MVALKKIQRSILPSLAIAILLLTAAGLRAAVARGDFESQVVFPSTGVPVSISVLVAFGPGYPQFSGRVVSGSSSESIKGSFSPVVESGSEAQTFQAYVKSLKGVPPFHLVFLPATGASVGDESLQVRFEGHEPFAAKNAVVLPPNSEGKAWTLNHTLAGVLRIPDEMVSTLDSRIAAVDESSDSRIQALQGIEKESEEFKSAYTSAQQRQTEAKSRLKTYQNAITNFGNLQIKVNKALQDGIAASEKVYTAISAALARYGVYAWEIDGAAQLITSAVFYKASAFEHISMDGYPDGSRLAGALDELMAITNPSEYYAAVLNLNLPITINIPPSTVGAFTKSFLSVVNTQLSTAKTAVAAYVNAKAALPSQSLQDLQEMLSAVLQEAGELDAEVSAVKKAWDVKALEATVAKYVQTRVLSERATLQASRARANFKGYSPFTSAVTSISTGKPVTTLVTGTSPDGQKFSYSSKLRTENTGGSDGVFYVNTAAGKNPLILEMGYQLRGTEDAADGSVTTSMQKAEWAGVELSGRTGRQVVSSKTANVFDGPTETNSDAFGGGALASTLRVAVGGAEDLAFSEGFGVRLTRENSVPKLLVVRKGAAFKVATTPTASAFSGAFPWNGSAAKNFSGVFLRNEDGSVAGYGSLSTSGASSEPVTVTLLESVGERVAPLAPQAPLAPFISWTGFKGTVLVLQITDQPQELNITSVQLYKGSKLISSTLASPAGSISIPTDGLSAGNDYFLRVTRELVSGINSADSSFFSVEVRTLPAYSYQTLLESGGVCRGRLQITTTSNGSWSGKLEWITWTPALNEAGQPSTYRSPSAEAAFVPILSTFNLKGVLNPSPNSETSPVFLSSIPIPTSQGAPGHRLSISLSDGEIPEDTLGLTPGSATALRMTASLNVENESPLFTGIASPACRGEATYKGAFQTVDIHDGQISDGGSHLFNYAGSGIISYTYSMGAGGTGMTGSAHVALDGSIPYLLFNGAFLKITMPYLSKAGKIATASMGVAGFLSGNIPWSIQSQGDGKQLLIGKSKDGGLSQIKAQGVLLEIAPKAKTGYVLRTDWGKLLHETEDLLISEEGSIHPAKRFVDFAPSEKFAAGTEYKFQIMDEDHEVVWEDTVKFFKTGNAQFSKAATASYLSLNANFLTGGFSGTLKVAGSLQREISTSGKAVKTTGFALSPALGPYERLFAWGSIEEGVIGWRIMEQ